MTVNIAVVGCGRMGQMHVQYLRHHPGCRLKAIVDPNTPKSWFEDHQLLGRYATWSDVLNNKEIHAVVIAASTDMHVSLIEDAAEAGKQIFCEKPISLNAQKILALQAKVESCGVILQVGFNRRFDAQFIKAKESLQSGRLGQCQTIRIFNRDPKRPNMDFIPRSGGLFFDFNVHDFDTLRYLTNDQIKSVFARGANLITPEIGALGDIDTAMINVEMESGILAVIDTCRETHFGYDQRVEILGNKGAIEVKNITQSTVKLTNSQGSHGACPEYSFVQRYQKAYRDQMDVFINAVKTDAPSTVTGLDCYQAVVACMAATLSYREMRPVQLSEMRQVASSSLEVCHDQ